MPACHNPYCLLGGFQEHLLLEDCLTSLVANKFFFLQFFLSLLLHWLFLTLRGITGFFQGGVYITLYVLTTEFVGPKHRSLAGTVVWIFYTSSLIILSGLAYGIREWRTLSIVISAPGFVLLILWRWESDLKTTHSKPVLNFFCTSQGKT